MENITGCPIAALLKSLSAKHKLQIFTLAVAAPLRFNNLLRQIEGSNKQTLATALKEMEVDGFLNRTVITEKPLHVEYVLSTKGEALIPIFKQLEGVV